MVQGEQLKEIFSQYSGKSVQPGNLVGGKIVVLAGTRRKAGAHQRNIEGFIIFEQVM